MTRISFEEVFMRMAEELSGRSTCKRLSVGTVLASLDMTRVIGLGYNGNARGFDNSCDRDEPGNCGCIHSEVNALIKADTTQPFIAFVTHVPCIMCAKLLINAGAKRVLYRNEYRNAEGLLWFARAGIGVDQVKPV